MNQIIKKRGVKMSREEIMQLVSHATNDKTFYKKLVTQPKSALQNVDFLSQKTKDSILEMKPEYIEEPPPNINACIRSCRVSCYDTCGLTCGGGPTFVW